MSSQQTWLKLLGDFAPTEEFQNLNWEGSFTEYLDIVKKDPKVTRNSFQRIYDMIGSWGTTSYIEYKKNIIHYKFFEDPIDHGKDAVFGLDVPLMKLTYFFKSAAYGYGTEKRVLLLHGPVGSAKSTIVRLLKKGLERYSRTNEGMLFTFKWQDNQENSDHILGSQHEMTCPMHEEPLKLIPEDTRSKFETELNQNNNGSFKVQIIGDLCPVCRHVQREFLKRYNGDWQKVMSHVRVKRFMLSEKDRVGIGTFQPKDEKNQDSTELTGDINYRKIAEYGSDSDPRAFNFDGEFNIANRGLVEFIEVLKLDVAFLYDLLGASQEHKIKPKKFSQTDI
ncbi:MAG: serine protein kinase, partial [Deltaproteobacteria bacterium]|nr:serine protein kinase [Deltaproteobacteria bacterium]